MNVVVVHLLFLLLLTQEASATFPSETTFPSPIDTAYSLAYCEPAGLFPTLCNTCELSLEVCRCLQGVQVDGWLSFPPSNGTSSGYFTLSSTGAHINEGSGLQEHSYGNAGFQGSTIRPEDILQHPEWPGSDVQNVQNEDLMPDASLYTHPLTMQHIAQLNQSAARAHSDTIEQWSNQTYNVGDRLSPPQPPVPGKRRYAAQPNGFPCDHSDCSRVFDRPCDLKRHKKKHVQQSERPHKCRQCEKAFIYPKDLDRHVKTHEPQKQTQKILCSVDGCKSAKTGFGRRDNYLRHMRDKHSGSSFSTFNTQSSS